MPSENRENLNPFRFWKTALIPVLLTFTAYLSIMTNGFVWDDEKIIRDNLYIRFLDGQSIHWMFTTFFMGNWTPLTWLSLALDYKIAGLDPRVYHFTNIFFHSLNTGLVFFLSFRILSLVSEKDRLVPGALLTALLFGLHPLHVESAAWAAERKDLLCGLFFLLSVWAYLDYALTIGSRRVKYLACLGFFALALMSKPMAITLPVVFLILDYWPLGRFKSHPILVLKDKIPFFALSLLTAVLAFSAQSDADAMPNLEKMPVDIRLMNVFHSIVFYLMKVAAPVNLAAFYPFPIGLKPFSAGNLIGLVLTLLISLACFLWRKQWPALATAWIFYLVTLAPVSGFFQVGSQMAADRYTYLPTLGLFLLLGGFTASALGQRRALFYQLSALVGTVLWVMTILQAGIWKNSITLWERVAAVTPNVSAMTYTNLAAAYQGAEMWDQALSTYFVAISLGPKETAPHEGKGLVLMKKGMLDQAALEFKTEISLDSKIASAHKNLSMTYQRLGNGEGALAEAKEGVKLEPNIPDSYSVLGGAHFILNQPDQAAEAFQKALNLDPDNDNYLFNLATAYESGNRYYEAAQVLQKAAARRTQDPAIYEKLAEVFEKSGRKDLAEIAMERARFLQGKHL